MNPIEYTATFGHERKKVVLVQPKGGGAGYQLYIDNYFQGTIVRVNGEWVFHFNRQTDLTGDDIGVLGEIIEGWEGGC